MRQLQLFKSKRQRGVKAPPPLEFADHCFLADVCRRWLMPGWKFTHLPFGEEREHQLNARGKRFSLAGQRLKRMGVMPGWPDFIFVGPERGLLFLELKRRGSGRLSDDQKDVHAHLDYCRFHVRVADGANDAVAILKMAGILRSTFEVQ